MRVDLVIDGNFILSKLVFTLHKHNLLFGGLHKALEVAVGNYRKWYPFTNIYLVSDSKEKSWRKEYVDNYKGTRKKDSDIDWNFVYTAYDEFKQSIKSQMTVLEAPKVEGDDWISYFASNGKSSGSNPDPVAAFHSGDSMIISLTNCGRATMAMSSTVYGPGAFPMKNHEDGLTCGGQSSPLGSGEYPATLAYTFPEPSFASAWTTFTIPAVPSRSGSFHSPE